MYWRVAGSWRARAVCVCALRTSLQDLSQMPCRATHRSHLPQLLDGSLLCRDSALGLSLHGCGGNFDGQLSDRNGQGFPREFGFIITVF